MERSQFTFYRSFWEAIKELPAKSKAEVICAICAYALEGEAPKLSGTSKAIFTLIKPTLDASARKAETGKLGGSKEKAKDKQSESKAEAEGKQNGREEEKEIEKENEGENECSPPIGDPPRSPKRKYGQYGWVRLTQEEYSRLKEDLGEAELNRCIEYVDESAQKSGNKNRWKDWKLVIRSCHRDGWGLSKYGRPVEHPKKPKGPTKEEYERMQRFLKELDGEDAEWTFGNQA
jgi:hypothetical protein